MFDPRYQGSHFVVSLPYVNSFIFHSEINSFGFQKATERANDSYTDLMAVMARAGWLYFEVMRF